MITIIHNWWGRHTLEHIHLTITHTCTNNRCILNFLYWENELFWFSVKEGIAYSRISPHHWFLKLPGWILIQTSFPPGAVELPTLSDSLRQAPFPSQKSPCTERCSSTLMSDKVYSSRSYPWNPHSFHPWRTHLSVLSPSPSHSFSISPSFSPFFSSSFLV